jgi:hypothetical protein
MTDGGAEAALLQIAKLKADLSKIQGQVTSNWAAMIGRLSRLSAQIEAAGAVVAAQAEDLQAVRQGLDELRGQAATAAGDGEGYSPIPAPRWWLLADDELAEAVDRLRDWVAAVYVPGYGSLAARLPRCWAEHPLCLFALDWLSEMHSVLYLQPERGARLLAAQAEWQTRLLPAAVDQMAAECRECAHAPAELNGARR